MRMPPPLHGATPRATSSSEGERSRVVGGEAKRLGILKVGFGFGYALELCVYWGRVGGVGAEHGGEADCIVEGVGCWIGLEGSGVRGKWCGFEFEFKFNFWVLGVMMKIMGLRNQVGEETREGQF